MLEDKYLQKGIYGGFENIFHIEEYLFKNQEIVTSSRIRFIRTNMVILQKQKDSKQLIDFSTKETTLIDHVIRNNKNLRSDVYKRALDY